MHALLRLVAYGVCAACTATAAHAQSRLGHKPNSAPSPSARAATALPSPGGLRPIFPAGVSSGSGAAVSSDPVAASTAPTAPGTTTTTTASVPGGTPTTGTSTGNTTTVTTTTGSTTEVPTELLPGTNVGAVTTVPGTNVNIIPGSTANAGAATTVPATTVPATNVLGAGATVPGPAQHSAGGAGGFAAADGARSFFFADANHDGELTRAEARRLSISTMNFEEMDRNFDGVVSRFEYEDSLR